MVHASDQPAVTDEAASLPLPGIAATPEGRHHGKIGNEQTKHDEDREATLAGEPEEHRQYDQHDADGRTFSDTGGPAASHRPKLMANGS
jgi:hypothetical protein